jgi:hypothetical protein
MEEVSSKIIRRSCRHLNLTLSFSHGLHAQLAAGP